MHWHLILLFDLNSHPFLCSQLDKQLRVHIAFSLFVCSFVTLYLMYKVSQKVFEPARALIFGRLIGLKNRSSDKLLKKKKKKKRNIGLIL